MNTDSVTGVQIVIERRDYFLKYNINEIDITDGDSL